MRAASRAASLGAKASSSASSTVRLQSLCRPGLARREHQHEFALLAMRIGEQPVPRLAERKSRHVLEFLIGQSLSDLS